MTKEYKESMSQEIRCVLCNKRLMKVLVISENGPSKKIQCTCPFCDGESDIITIEGISYTSPIPENDEFDNSSTPTVISDVSLNNGVFIFSIRKK